MMWWKYFTFTLDAFSMVTTPPMQLNAVERTRLC